MTSLCPGPLFQSSGLNHNSTPTPPTASPSEIDRKLTRQPFNGRDWPRESPVARVYDIANTSTSLVLLNRRRKKKCQLRGLTVRNGEIVAPEPRRHAPEEPTVNWQHHKQCTVSTSEPFRPRVNLDLGWVNTTQRPPVRFDSGSHVNHRRHTSCRVSGDSPVVGWRGIPRRPATTTAAGSVAGGVDSELRSISPLLNDPDISHGGRRYLYSIARIYSTSQMKQLKQDQYQQLLCKEFGKGYHSPKEYERYLNYLNTPRKTQYGKLDNYEEMRRARSVPPGHSDDSGRGGESTKSAGRKQKRTPCSSRSWAPSMVSSGSRPSTRQKANGKKAQRQQSPLPPSPKPASEDTASKDHHSSELDSEEDPTDHTRKEESEVGEEEPLARIKESEEDSYQSKDKTSTKSASTASTRKEAEPAQVPLSTAPKDEDGVSPRKGDEGGDLRNDVLSPRKGEEPATPRKDEVDGPAVQEGKEERSSEGAAPSTTIAAPSSSTNTTSNNFLALIVSDAEKDDDKTAEDSSEQEKQSSAVEESSAATATASQQPQQQQQQQEHPEMARKFSDIQMASGHTPRMNKEGRTRPLSRAGRGREQGQEKDNSDDDYDDTDDETEKTNTEAAKDKKEASSPPPPPPQKQQQQQAEEKKEEEPVQRSALEAEPQVLDSSRTEDSKTEERGEIDNEPTTTVDQDKRAGTPDEGRDERAQDSQEAEGPRSLIIPVSDQAQGSSGTKTDNVLDLSAEQKNRDVDKLEY